MVWDESMMTTTDQTMVEIRVSEKREQIECTLMNKNKKYWRGVLAEVNVLLGYLVASDGVALKGFK